MKIHTPEISWHNHGPVLCIDVQPESRYRLATGGNDGTVYIWKFYSLLNRIDVLASLVRHQKAVGAIRFATKVKPNLLASGDDDGYIIIWQLCPDSEPAQLQEFGNEDQIQSLECWKQYKVLRGHIEDICDLSWSQDSQYLVSGSVDNSVILWNVEKSIKLFFCDDSRGFVQGVAFDPQDQYFAAISSDRTLRVYDYKDKKLAFKSRRSNVEYKDNVKLKAMFHDDTLKSFCRRIEYSPCGQYLLAPSGIIQSATDDTNSHINACFLYKRNCLSKPLVSYPTGKECALCVRFCPQYFKLRKHEENILDLPYRMIFAVATSRSVLLFDSQQSIPICFFSQIHLARLTDLSWSSDGRLLMISSTDAYCTFATFELEELGEEETDPQPAKAPSPKQAVTPKNVATPKQAAAPRQAVTPKAATTPKNPSKARQVSPVSVEKPQAPSGPRQSSLLQFIQTSKQPILNQSRRIEPRPIDVISLELQEEVAKETQVKRIEPRRIQPKPIEVITIELPEGDSN